MEEQFFHTPECFETPETLLKKIARGEKDADQGIAISVENIEELRQVANDTYLGKNDEASEGLCAAKSILAELVEAQNNLVEARKQLKNGS